MESTFAADYYEVNGTFHQIDHNYLWTKDPEKKPYIIHWAGCRMFEGYEIDKLFLKYLKGEEIQEWHEWVTNSKNKSKTSYFQSRIAKLKSAIKILIS